MYVMNLKEYVDFMQQFTGSLPRLDTGLQGQ